MSETEMSDGYLVGYGKPPKNTRFRKGISGNPSGRPKKALDFFAELRREANRPITINENGRRICIPKIRGIARQATNKALAGHNSSMKTFVGFYQQAVEEEAMSAAQEASDFGKHDHVKKLSEEELMRVAAAGLKETEKENKK
jgi:hypothetical protein